MKKTTKGTIKQRCCSTMDAGLRVRYLISRALGSDFGHKDRRPAQLVEHVVVDVLHQAPMLVSFFSCACCNCDYASTQALPKLSASPIS